MTSGIEMRGIVKRFGATIANRGVDFDVRPGEIHALLGENGAGKTTLMQILYGLLQPDDGEIRIGGRRVRFATPCDASDAGIGMVHQHFKLVPTLTVAENVVLGERKRLVLGRRALREAAARLTELGSEHGLELPPFAIVGDLSVGEQQRTEILKALYRGARFLILDEPTANLAAPEVLRLLAELRAMADAGAGLVIITHHLEEAIQCADRISVLRRGSHVASVAPAETTATELAQLMVGRGVDLRARRPRRLEVMPTAEPEAALLAVDELSVVRGDGGVALDRVSFAVGAGEILAITGVEGNGQRELEEVLQGLRPATSGSMRLGAVDVLGGTPADLLRHGLGFIPADRYRRGLVTELSIGENLVLDRFGRPPYGSWWALRPTAIAANGVDAIRRFAVGASSPATPAAHLSGGHAQRVVLARAMRDDLRVLIASQPTRGLDVGASEFVWERLSDLAVRGVAVLLLSGDVDEVTALADRCHVIYRGRLTGSFDRPSDMREQIGRAMGGLAADVGRSTGAAA